MEEELSKKDGEKDVVKEELETLKKEQEDLLVLLADQDTKIDKYKQKLKELGQEVSTVKVMDLVSYDIHCFV
jgi:predicted nuclease with TOPRIM domain